MSRMHYAKSPLLLSAHTSVLVRIDLQEKLLPVIGQSATIAWNIDRLTRAARLCDVPIITTEQYPSGLGPTLQPLRVEDDQAIEKMSFSCAASDTFGDRLDALGRQQLLIVGIETHVCVLQTVFDLLSQGFAIFVVVDAVGSRYLLDHEVAIRRMESCGASLVTTESAVFEWCEEAGTDRFRDLRKLVLEPVPTVIS